MNLNAHYALDATHYPKPTEAWYQVEEDLWRGAKDVMLNTAALNEREAYFDIIRVTNGGQIYKAAVASAYTL